MKKEETKTNKRQCPLINSTGSRSVKAVRKAQVKSGVIVSWALLYCERWFSLTTTTTCLWFYL